MTWPAQSPDLNPIEHLWDEVGRQLRGGVCKNSAELLAAIEEQWAAITVARLEQLVDSMRRRCEAVIWAKGYSTRY